LSTIESSDQPTASPYSSLPLQGRYDVAIGCALILLAEPHEGCDREYNRWYEDEHMPMAFTVPWKFAGRRWVAPLELQSLRYPQDSPLARPLSAGKYLAVYWITPERYPDHKTWALSKNKRDVAEGRFYFDVDHVYMSFPSYRGVVYRDERGPRDIHALSYPYQGIVVEVLEPSGSRDELIDWLRDEYLPARLSGSPIAMTLLFEPNPLRAAEDAAGGHLERFVISLSFIELPPAECWTAMFAGAGDVIASSGKGRVVLSAPFCPTLPGTDVYVDQLR
jgi:hypothetical protein